MTTRRDTSRWPKEFRSHLYPMPADQLHDFAQTYIFMSASALETECEAIAKCLPADLYAQPPTLEESIVLGQDFARLAPFVDPPSDDALRNTLAPLPLSQSLALAARLQQAHRAIWQARHLHGRDYDPTDVFAVPPIWHHRWETVIGGALHPAFVGFLKVGQF